MYDRLSLVTHKIKVQPNCHCVCAFRGEVGEGVAARPSGYTLLLPTCVLEACRTLPLFGRVLGKA